AGLAPPGGRGQAGERWTRANDRRMIDLVEAMDAEGVIPEAAERMNACGAGAIAAAVAACRQLGASRGICLDYTNSYVVVHEKYPHDPDDTTVGYASIVFA
ncbi:MAG: AmmeMemoRadiSam system protein B, partial [Planctomycetes bacterium]|nr:AmmeMemoRadiSam system protein B [Planctomycetota bacterium]